MSQELPHCKTCNIPTKNSNPCCRAEFKWMTGPVSVWQVIYCFSESHYGPLLYLRERIQRKSTYNLTGTCWTLGSTTGLLEKSINENKHWKGFTYYLLLFFYHKRVHCYFITIGIVLIWTKKQNKSKAKQSKTIQNTKQNYISDRAQGKNNVPGVWLPTVCCCCSPHLPPQGGACD